MDLLWMLEDKLWFIWWFYGAAAAPFTEIRRKIEAGEEPYVDRRNPEDYDEPAFLQEFGEAVDALDVLGQSCLSLVQSSLKEYILGFVKERLRGKPEDVKHMPGDGWFEKHQRFFLDAAKMDWTVAPVDLDVIEQINLARNDIQHGGDAWGLKTRQTKDHHRRFPDGIFANEADKRMNEPLRQADVPFDPTWPARIEVDREKLRIAIDAVHTFAAFIEGGCNRGHLGRSEGSQWAPRWPPREDEIAGAAEAFIDS